MSDLTARRRAYAEELRAISHLRSDALVDGFATVPREHFLGPGPWQIVSGIGRNQVRYKATKDADPTHLYQNVLVAIDPVRYLNNGEPASLAAWIDCLNLRSRERVVHIGCAYTTQWADKAKAEMAANPPL